MKTPILLHTVETWPPLGLDRGDYVLIHIVRAATDTDRQPTVTHPADLLRAVEAGALEPVDPPRPGAEICVRFVLEVDAACLPEGWPERASPPPLPNTHMLAERHPRRAVARLRAWSRAGIPCSPAPHYVCPR